MAWVRIPFQEQWQNANDVNAAGFVIKTYLPGTTTPTPMAIDKDGNTTVATVTLNADGLPEVSGNEVAIYIDRDFKYAIYENATDASNDANAFYGPIDNVKLNALTDLINEPVADYAAIRNLTAADLTANSTIQVTNSGIAGTFILRNSVAHGLSDNGGTIIVINSDWYAERVEDGMIWGNWFGMDVVAADNSAAFSSFAAYLLANPEKEGVVGPGSYTFTLGVTVTGTTVDKFTLRGLSRRGTVFTTSSAITILQLEGTAANTFQYPTIEGITFTAGNASAYCIKTRNTESLKINDCIFTGTGVGIGMSEVATETDIKPRITNNIFATATGILGGDTRVADAWVVDNLFLDCTSTCILFGYLDGGMLRGNQIFSNNGSGNALRGINLKQPIYVDIIENRFFENGGEAIKMTSPRYCTIERNKIVGVGDNANQSAIDIDDYDASTPALDTTIRANVIKDTGGHGLDINSSSTIQSGYVIEDNEFEEVGSGAVIYDAMRLVNITDTDLINNRIDGQSATRYWLNLDGSTGITLNDNKHKNCVNDDVFRANSPSMIIQDSTRVTTGTTSTITLLYDDDGVICGTLTSGITINLPSATSNPGKKVFVRWTAGAFDITVDPAGSQTIDGSSTATVNSASPSLTIVSNGSNWYSL